MRKKQNLMFKNMKNILKTSYGSEYLIDDLKVVKLCKKSMQTISTSVLKRLLKKALNMNEH